MNHVKAREPHNGKVCVCVCVVRDEGRAWEGRIEFSKNPRTEACQVAAALWSGPCARLASLSPTECFTEQKLSNSQSCSSVAQYQLVFHSLISFPDTHWRVFKNTTTQETQPTQSRFKCE